MTAARGSRYQDITCFRLSYTLHIPSRNTRLAGHLNRTVKSSLSDERARPSRTSKSTSAAAVVPRSSPRFIDAAESSYGGFRVPLSNSAPCLALGWAGLVKPDARNRAPNSGGTRCTRYTSSHPLCTKPGDVLARNKTTALTVDSRQPGSQRNVGSQIQCFLLGPKLSH